MITLTDSASAKVKELIEAEGNSELALRVAVRPGGCSGFSYEMFFDTDFAPDDLKMDYGGVKVVGDPASAQWLGGASLAYKEGPLGGGVTAHQPTTKPGEDYPWRVKIVPDLVLDEESWVPSESVGPGLVYVQKWPPEHWKLAFQGNLHHIPDEDFATLRRAIAAAR